MRGAVSFKKNAFLKTEDAARVFLDNGEVPAIGYIIKQPDLATASSCWRARAPTVTTRRIREKARRRRTQLGGNWTEADLANYKVVERPPVVGHYRGAAHRVGLAADVGRYRADRCAEHPRRLRPRQGRQRDAHASHRRSHASRAS
jgi:hypothetical protein